MLQAYLFTSSGILLGALQSHFKKFDREKSVLPYSFHYHPGRAKKNSKSI